MGDRLIMLLVFEIFIASICMCSAQPVAGITRNQVEAIYRRSTSGMTNAMLQTLWKVVKGNGVKNQSNNEDREENTKSLQLGKENSSHHALRHLTGDNLQKRPGELNPGGTKPLRCFFNAVSCFY